MSLKPVHHVLMNYKTPVDEIVTQYLQAIILASYVQKILHTLMFSG